MIVGGVWCLFFEKFVFNLNWMFFCVFIRSEFIIFLNCFFFGSNVSIFFFVFLKCFILSNLLFCLDVYSVCLWWSINFFLFFWVICFSFLLSEVIDVSLNWGIIVNVGLGVDLFRLLSLLSCWLKGLFIIGMLKVINLILV